MAAAKSSAVVALAVEDNSASAQTNECMDVKRFVGTLPSLRDALFHEQENSRLGGCVLILLALCRVCLYSSTQMKTYCTVLLMVCLSGFIHAANQVSVPLNNFSVNAQSRQDVIALWNTVYRPMMNVPTGWQGNIASGNAGTTTDEFKDAVLSRLNWYRAMAGVSAQCDIDYDWSRKCQEAALVMDALPYQEGVNPHLLHPSWRWYTADAAWAASRSNFSFGDPQVTTVDAFIEDYGATNYSVGHRSGALTESMDRLGVGAAGRSMYTTVLGGTSYTPRPPRDGFIAWPPKGYVPYSTTYPRWSFEIPRTVLAANNYLSIDPSHADVTVTCNGRTVPCTIEYRLGTLVFLLWGADANNKEEDFAYYSRLLSGGRTDRLLFVDRGDRHLGITNSNTFPDVTYRVTVSGLLAQGFNTNTLSELEPISYDVVVFDPEASHSAPPVYRRTDVSLNPEQGTADLSAQAQGIVNGVAPTIAWFRGGVGDTSNPLPSTESYPNGYTQAYDYELAPPTSKLTVPIPATGHAYYWARATNPAGSTNSVQLVVAALSPVEITQQPAGRLFPPSGYSLLSVAASGSKPITYQWYRGRSGDVRNPIAGAVSSTLPVPGVIGDYWVRVANPVSQVYSATAEFRQAPKEKSKKEKAKIEKAKKEKEKKKKKDKEKKKKEKEKKKKKKK